MSRDPVIHGPLKAPYRPPTRAMSTAEWEKQLATIHSPRAPKPTPRWNGVKPA